MAGARLDGWTEFFLATTILTSVTGFGFPFTKVTPPHVVGAFSLVMLAVCLASRYWKHLGAGWRVTYVIGTMARVYLNVFVLVHCSSSPRRPPLRSWRPRGRRRPSR